MADNRTIYTIREDEENGSVRVSEEVLAIIAGLAATEVKGVASMAGGMTNDIIAKLGMKNLRSGVNVVVDGDVTSVDLALTISYGYSIVDVSTEVQERVKAAIESMTGLTVDQVNVRVADVSVKENKE